MNEKLKKQIRKTIIGDFQKSIDEEVNRIRTLKKEERPDATTALIFLKKIWKRN